MTAATAVRPLSAAMTDTTGSHTIIVMISGWAGSGKDATAALMAEEMGFVRFAFADAAKQECAFAYGLPIERFYHGKDRPLEAQIPPYPDARTPRQLLLHHAADARLICDALYARMVVNEIKASKVHRIVISDWRYHVEYATLRDAFPDARIVTARIERSGIQQSAHPSEHELDHVQPTLRIQNDGSISDLRDTLKMWLRPYLTR